MNRVLIDSSVWIDYFKKTETPVTEHVNALLDDDKVALCGMIELEILQGIRGKEFDRIQLLFEALHYIETNREDYINAGLMLNQLRSKGITIPASDCLIATLCVKNHLSLFTLDGDFDHINLLKKYKFKLM